MKFSPAIGARIECRDFDFAYFMVQNKADVGSAIVRKWLDVDGVDAVVDVPNSAVGLTVNSLLRDSRMTFLASSTASSDLTGKACSPNTIQWVNDAWATGNTTAAAMMARGGTDWYFLTVNYALGQGIEAEASHYIEAHGGKVLGSSKHPLGTSDFASFLLQAQGSKAKVIGLANAGGDTINAVKQAAEFGIQRAFANAPALENSPHHFAAALGDQARGALIAGVDPQPAHRDAQPVAQADQEIDVGDAP